MTKKEIEQKAEELTQEYFQKYGGITCSWGNVNQIIQNVYKKGYEKGTKAKADLLATFINVDLEKENEKLKEMFEIVCKERYGYAWIQRKSDIIEKLKRRIENDR